MSYIKIRDSRMAYIDVDQTLIDWECSNKDLPLLLLKGPNDATNVQAIPVHIDLIKELRTVGWQIVVWSQGGADHAERVVKLLGIENLVDVIISKPTIYVDDLPFENQYIKRVFKL